MDRRKFFKNITAASIGVVFAPAVIVEMVKDIPDNKPRLIPWNVQDEKGGIFHYIDGGWIYSADGKMAWTEKFEEAEFMIRQQIDLALFMGKR